MIRMTDRRGQLPVKDVERLLNATQHEHDDGYSSCGVCCGGGWGWPKHTENCLWVQLMRLYFPERELRN